MPYYFKQGYDAFKSGRSMYSCPYLWGHSRERWLAGWEFAREESI